MESNVGVAPDVARHRNRKRNDEQRRDHRDTVATTLWLDLCSSCGGCPSPWKDRINCASSVAIFSVFIVSSPVGRSAWLSRRFQSVLPSQSIAPQQSPSRWFRVMHAILFCRFASRPEDHPTALAAWHCDAPEVVSLLSGPARPVIVRCGPFALPSPGSVSRSAVPSIGGVAEVAHPSSGSDALDLLWDVTLSEPTPLSSSAVTVSFSKTATALRVSAN
jgi:hypothetical protein